MVIYASVENQYSGGAWADLPLPQPECVRAIADTTKGDEGEKERGRG